MSTGIQSYPWAFHRAVFPPSGGLNGWHWCCSQNQHRESQWLWPKTAGHREALAVSTEVHHCSWGKCYATSALVCKVTKSDTLYKFTPSLTMYKYLVGPQCPHLHVRTYGFVHLYVTNMYHQFNLYIQIVHIHVHAYVCVYRRAFIFLAPNHLMDHVSSAILLSCTSHLTSPRLNLILSATPMRACSLWNRR